MFSGSAHFLVIQNKMLSYVCRCVEKENKKRYDEKQLHSNKCDDTNSFCYCFDKHFLLGKKSVRQRANGKEIERKMQTVVARYAAFSSPNTTAQLFNLIICSMNCNRLHINPFFGKIITTSPYFKPIQLSTHRNR